MKILVFALVVLAGLCHVGAEIIPRFPGVQPVLINGTNGDTPSVNVQFRDTLVIDEFTYATAPPVIIVLPAGGAPPVITRTAHDRDDSILGGERDIILTANTGIENQVLTAGATTGVFSVSTPKDASGVTTLQYDGVDGNSGLDSEKGLGAIDLTANEAVGFRILADSDYDTEFVLSAYDSAGRVASATAFVPGGDVTRSYEIDFDEFDNILIDFSSITALQVVIQGFENVDFNLQLFAVYGSFEEIPNNCFNGTVLPCDTDYYRVVKLDNVTVGDYLVITFNTTSEEQFPNTQTRLYVKGSDFDNLQEELASNDIILDTLGALPSVKNYDYVCDNNCKIEIVWSALQNTTYYLALEGHGNGPSNYLVCLSYRSVPVFPLENSIPEPIFLDHRPTVPPDDRVLHYRYYVISIPEEQFSPGTYLTVNVSRAEPFPGPRVRLMYESLPETAFDTGVIDSVDFNSQGQRVDQMVYPYCVNTSRPGQPYYEHPGSSDPRIPCECQTGVSLFGSGPAFQLTCNLTVDPCRFKYGNWYISVELPEREKPNTILDFSGRTNYTIEATVVQPAITDLNRNVTYHAFVVPQAAAHFSVDVPAREIIPGESHLHVHVSNVRNGLVNVYVHQGLGVTKNLAGGREACVPANATCSTCDACNVIIEKCHFAPGTWYISVEVNYNETSESFSVFDTNRMPLTFTVRANWLEDAEPTRLISGVPASKYIGAGLYDFYVINVPPTVDTWLFVELFTRAEDTEAALSILHGDLPGGECYHRPDFYCLTGDVRELRWTTGQPTFLVNQPVQRESCVFMIQTCELQAGPLFFSVYGFHTGYAAYGNNTYYQLPVHYTLYVDFDVPLALSSGVSLSETVFEKQYQHYYIRADQIYEGSWMTVEVTNIQHGVPQSIEAFVNYNYLAGDCPCYENLYNCTGRTPCRSVSQVNRFKPAFLPDIESVYDCCTIIVPQSDFRPGVWYVSVLGLNEDYYQYTTPIGYTLTVTIHDPPPFTPLILGQPYHGYAPQWNITYEYAQFRLGATPIPLNDLVLKLTFVQNCDFMGKHDDTYDALWLYVNQYAPANELGYDYACKANVFGESFCTIVIPHCEWKGETFFVAVKGDYDAVFKGRFTLQATTEAIRDIALVDGVSHYDRVGLNRYKHFVIDSAGLDEETLNIDVYTNQDQDSISVYVNKDSRAGQSPCYDNMYYCESDTMCSWQILACDLEQGHYYISVYGSGHQFYDTSVEFTITATFKPVSDVLFLGNAVSGHLWNGGDIQHYYFNVTSFRNGSILSFEVDNVKHGIVQVYSQFGSLAGRCPCFVWEQTCVAASSNANLTNTNEWCEIRIPACELQIGKYFFSVVAVNNVTPDPPVFRTPIGFTVEANLILPSVVVPPVEVGRNINNTYSLQFVANQRYNHYEVMLDEDDWVSGYHLIVEISKVQGGSLFVYYNPGFPGDSNSGCHVAEICSSGLAPGDSCYWQLPYCLTKPVTQGASPYYITVEGLTGRTQASYNILIYKEPVPTVVSDPFFTLDGTIGSGGFPAGAELNITHDPSHEPNGWTQFIRLVDVAHSDADGRGEMLELFFYRITNNVGESLDFNVYVHPNKPAGAHGCCADDELGYCQEAPCSSTADTTVSMNNSPDFVSHTCSFNRRGTGNQAVNDPFYGEICTVRVWPCEFEKYCEDTQDWFVSVVPVSATNPDTAGAGLSYSFQWRVQNIRVLSESSTIGSFDLTPTINNYGYTQVFGVTSNTTENSGWSSFFVDWNSANGRLSIQTNWVAGTGVVFINGDEFASYTESCHQYNCTTFGAIDCSSDGRFISTECCSSIYTRYYITVQNLGAVGSTLQWQFRIVSIELPETTVIPSHPTIENPYFSEQTQSVFSGVTGVEGDNYNFYELTITREDLSNHSSWVIVVERPRTEDVGSLQVFIRYGVEAGSYGADLSQAYYGNEPETCHTWLYECSPELGLSCIFEIPHCALIPGHYYVTIYNPEFNVADTPTDLPDYQLMTFFTDVPTVINTTDLYYQDYIPDNSTTYYNDFGLLRVYAVNISADELNYDPRSRLQNNYWNSYLRFQIDMPRDSTIVTTTTLLVNKDDIPGDNSLYPCSSTIASNTCFGMSCSVDVVPCAIGNEKLTTGTYYLAVRQSIPTSYTVYANIYTEEYTQIPLLISEEGTGHRAGTTNQVWRWYSSPEELLAEGDGRGNYRYVIDPSVDYQDDIDDSEYFLVNITTNGVPEEGAVIDLEVWRDDCTRYSCALNGSKTWCTIDAIGLAPCSAKSGRFYFNVNNPLALDFTLYFYRNQSTIQNIQEDQTITEIVYPYEYQQYFFEASDVGEGSTLNVRICAICGEVQAFIRPDLPAGPGPAADGGADSCAIDTCIASGPKETSFDRQNNCCSLFLDTCEYEQRGYYIGIRGVTTVYPDASNEKLYLPAKYEIEPKETKVNFTDVSFSCPVVVEYDSSWNNNPQQYTFDVETVNVGTVIKVSMRLSSAYEIPANSTESASLWINPNRSLGYTDACNTYAGCSISAGQDSCAFLIPYCTLSSYSAARFYLWANAPRGTQIVVERWDPSIPIVHPNLAYHGTINHNTNVLWDLPYTPGYQLYRFDLDPNGDERFYEKLLVRVNVSNVWYGSVAASVNSGVYPYLSGTGCDAPVFLDDSSCRSVGVNESCYIEITYPSLLQGAQGNERNIPTTFWLTIWGVEQMCELHSIQYTFNIQTSWLLTYFPPGDTICTSVEEDHYNFHRLRPHAVETLQESILRFEITDLHSHHAEQVTLIIEDDFIASKSSSSVSISSEGANTLRYDYICGYSDLHFSVYGDSATESHDIAYRMSVDKLRVPVHILTEEEVYHADDDDDDACPHPHDFYIFNTTTSTRGKARQAGSFFRVAVDSEFSTTVYVNKDTFAWQGCSDSGFGQNDPALTGTTTVNVYDFCDYTDGVYYVTVVSDGPYYIFADVRDDVIPLQLGNISTGVVQAGEYQMYTLEICDEWFNADDRLVIEISDVQNGNVSGWIRKNANPGVKTRSDGSKSCADFSALASYAPGNTGYDYLLVDSCNLAAGTYHILVRSSPRNENSRDCTDVSYRLFPYLVDYEIEPDVVAVNTVFQATVDYYTINRIERGALQAIRYYSFQPLQTGEYMEQVSQAIVKLYNVEGGLLRLRVARDHLAVPQYGYFSGETTAVIKSVNPANNLVSGSRPHTLQPMIDVQSRRKVYAQESGCENGCADYCCELSFDQNEPYAQDSSCALWLPSCYFTFTDYYIAVESTEQFYQDHHITFNLMVEQQVDYTLLQPDTNKVGQFSEDNWDYDLYYSISSEPESMRWRVVVSEGEGVLVTVRNHRCPQQANWEKQVWCDANSFDRPWLCDIEIPTRVAHPGDNAYFISVNGKNATYSIAFWRGRENCHIVHGTGRSDGLDFCAGMVPYATWRWDNYEHLDHEARCFFEHLYEHFRVQPCWSGVSEGCNATLQQFACYESFHGCDAQGFATGTCRDACDAVVYECVNWFESVDLEHYNCTSHRYLDSRVESCTGGEDFVDFNPENGLFLPEDPNLILYKSAPGAFSNSAQTMTVSSFVTLLVALVLVVLL